MRFKHFFIPHPDTHKKAHLISSPALVIYILLFIFLQVNLDNLRYFKPGVLGISSNIDTETLIQLTNNERVKDSLTPLRENSELDKAALAKGQDMFKEDYWAHYAPSGKSPWDFIQAAGYKFSYAGENLARNFYNSSDVVAAWMASPSHRENILNTHYQDIGMAVLQGTLQGQQTTLVVEEFGTPINYVAAAPQTPTQTQSAPVLDQTPVPLAPQVAGQESSRVLIDPYSLEKNFGLAVLFMIAALTLLDIYIMKRRGVLRVSVRHLPHLAILFIAATALVVINPGGIL